MGQNLCQNMQDAFLHEGFTVEQGGKGLTCLHLK